MGDALPDKQPHSLNYTVFVKITKISTMQEGAGCKPLVPYQLLKEECTNTVGDYTVFRDYTVRDYSVSRDHTVIDYTVFRDYIVRDYTLFMYKYSCTSNFSFRCTKVW